MGPLTAFDQVVNSMKQEAGTVIARRAYFTSAEPNARPVVEVEIGMPTKSPRHSDEFQCSFLVRAAGSDRTETVYGIDGLQALLLALGYLEAVLQKLSTSSDLRLRCVGGESGDLGIRIPNFSS